MHKSKTRRTTSIPVTLAGGIPGRVYTKKLGWTTFSNEENGVHCFQATIVGETGILRNSKKPDSYITGTHDELAAIIGDKKMKQVLKESSKSA